MNLECNAKLDGIRQQYIATFWIFLHRDLGAASRNNCATHLSKIRLFEQLHAMFHLNCNMEFLYLLISP